METQKHTDFAALILRISLGVMYLMHSAWLKGVIYTLPGTARFFASLGLPPILAYAVFAAEVVGGVLLILGVQTRVVAAALLPIMLGAVWAHSGNGWLFTNSGGGWEYPLFLAVASVVQILIGNGAYALRLPRRTQSSSAKA